MLTPLVKWAGGKREQAAHIADLLGTDGVYVEPFFGGGAVFCELVSRDAVFGAQVSDLNWRLMTLYQMVGFVPDEVAAYLDTLPWGPDWPDHYYRLRAAFNHAALEGIERAALLLWLNRHGFNGLYRENSKGEYNVPAGKFSTLPSNPRNLVMAWGEELRARCAWTVAKDWRVALFLPVRPLCRIYLDPPYHATFSKYTGCGFDEQDHQELAFRAGELVEAGHRVVVSNADTPLIRDLYDAWEVEEVPARRSISRTGDRTPAKELLFHGGPR